MSRKSVQRFCDNDMRKHKYLKREGRKLKVCDALWFAQQAVLPQLRMFLTLASRSSSPTAPGTNSLPIT
ncbi:hypothetical protein E0H39_02995 [Rhizobium leguminosarum bv. viciae]|nr:hypothetical protein [Rhizobium leguminosarum bv. viciae]PUB64934.1 hypothetical protein DB728_09550 [Rhizobium leguminosarum bv. viciae USDA 2370]NKK17945.1 hypothetical protein [Rhizobium leguminosarum bv. viciae]NKK31652.1 hypothetical protein [Rhizobium leguminosarum bv. viciae]NKK38769.1 hypothetical protein [Rhizobium leguminosarum bv. viciae]